MSEKCRRALATLSSALRHFQTTDFGVLMAGQVVVTATWQLILCQSPPPSWTLSPQLSDAMPSRTERMYQATTTSRSRLEQANWALRLERMCGVATTSAHRAGSSRTDCWHSVPQKNFLEASSHSSLWISVHWLACVETNDQDVLNCIWIEAVIGA